MDLMQRPANIARQLVEINLNTMGKMFQLTGTGVQQLMELNADYVQRLSQPEGLQDMVQLQRDYGQSLFEGIREDLQERGQVLRGAFEQTSEVLRDGWNDAATAVEEGVHSAADKAKAVASDVVEQVEDEIEDHLAQINGVGETFAEQLREAGIFTLAQVALISLEDLEDESHPLHSLKGRMESEQWIEQAKDLLNPLS